MAIWRPPIDEAKRPFNVVMLALAVAGAIFGVLGYVETLKKTYLSYAVGQTLKIYDSSVPNEKLKLVKTDGSQISKNVYAVEVWFWNSSDLYIDSKQIGMPINFIIDN